MNDCKFVGNLTEDIKLSSVKLNDGTSKSKGTIKLALNDYGRQSTFIDIAVWGATAENCSKYLKKGMPVAVTAYVENNNYEKGGTKIYSYQFTADKVEFIKSEKAQKDN